ncbi:MAG: HisA/HisF-related TIM barrel protein [Gemmataceae bacterium]
MSSRSAERQPVIFRPPYANRAHFTLKIVPVLDVMNGVVVHAVAGRRSEYRPIISQLTTSTDPGDVLRALIDATGSDCAYLADLDAITGKTTASPAVWKLVERISTPLTLWLDAGIRTTSDLESWPVSNDPSVRVIPVFGTESLKEWDVIPAAKERFGNAIVSLDFVDGRLLTGLIDAEGMEIVSRVKSLGVNQFIVLDLSAVGTGQERTSKICRQLLEQFPDLALYPGGGIQNRRDLERFQSLGVFGVLVASALHRRILP